MTQEAQGAAPSVEYPIRALVRANPNGTLGGDMPGRVFNWRKLSGHGDGYKSEFGCFDSQEPDDFPFSWFARGDDLIIDPTPEQIAEERQKAGLPAFETAPAVPEPVRAEGPDPLVKELVEALNTIEGQAVCGPIAVDFDEALEMLERIATLSRKAIDRAGGIRG